MSDKIYKVKYLPLVLLACAIIIGLYSCIDEIGLNVDTEQRSVVVNGFVTDSLGDYRVQLSESSVIGIGNDNILTPINNATVQIMDTDGGSRSYTASVDEEGVYILSDFEAVEGKAYFIDIILADGRHYRSQPQTLRGNSTIESVAFDVEESTFRNNAGELVTENRITAKISSDITGTDVPPYLRWRVEGEYQIQEAYPMALNPKKCYVKVNLDINDIRILDATEVNGDVLFEQEIAETEYDFRFGEQFCFHIYQFSISQEEYEYWRTVRELIDIDGSLFDPPPGTVIGNLYNVDDRNDVPVGYFSVASVFLQRAFINTNELEVSVRDKCSGFRFNVPFGCMNCLDITNSTTVRPSYWEI